MSPPMVILLPAKIAQARQNSKRAAENLSLTQPSTSESKQPRNVADEAKKVNKLRMLLNAVKKVEAENQQQEERQLMEDYQNAKVIWRRPEK